MTFGQFDWKYLLEGASCSMPAASGAFMSDANYRPSAAPVSGEVVIFNVGVIGDAGLIEKEFEGPRAKNAALEYIGRELGGHHKGLVKWLSPDDIVSLGEASVMLAVRHSQARYHLTIFPLRGGWRLGTILRQMGTHSGPSEFVLFSEAVGVRNDRFFLDQLSRAIEPRAVDNFRLAVVDVGESGAGMSKMRDLLRELRRARFARQNWRVDFHMFVPPCHAAAYPQRSTHTDGFTSEVVLYVTNVDLLDDWVNAMGLAKRRSRVLTQYGEIEIALPAAVDIPAAILVQDGGKIRVLGSAHGVHAGNTIISRAGTSFASKSMSRLPSEDRWPKSH